MMHKRLTTLLLALLGSVFVSAPHQSTPRLTPPSGLETMVLPGPGGVAYAVKEFLQRLDADNDSAVALLDRAHEISFVFDKKGALEQVDRQVTPSFIDVTVDGEPIAAHRAKAFVKLLQKSATTSESAKREVSTEIRGIRCNCDSPRSSLAVVEFDRVFTIDRVLHKRVPMRATALLAYDGDVAAKWHIFHWHASRAGEPQMFKGGK